jgi:hypothetical protein
MSDLADHEFPSSRADVQLRREAEFRIEAPGGFKALLRLVNPGSGNSPESVAVTMLIVAVASCIPPGLLGAFGRLADAPALPLLAAVAGLFVIVFATCTILVVRASRLQPVVPLSAIRDQVPHVAPPRKHKVKQNGHKPKSGQSGDGKRRVKPSRR